MAHNLPPKIPNITTTATPNWPHFADSPSAAHDFLGFSSGRRGLHRRSVSDSIAFLETPTPMMMMSQISLLGSASSNNNNNAAAFDGFDEEQFRSIMLSDDQIPPNEDDDQPTSSDHNSNDKLEAAAANEEVQSRQCNNATTNISSHQISDPKRVKRILANRQSARRSRVRKLQYITELERTVTTLQAEVSMLSPRVAFLDQQRLLLNVDNSALKQRIATLSQDKIFKDADQEVLKREIERLGQLYHRQQKNQRMECNNVPSPVVITKEPTSPGDQKQKLLYV